MSRLKRKHFTFVFDFKLQILGIVKQSNKHITISVRKDKIICIKGSISALGTIPILVLIYTSKQPNYTIYTSTLGWSEEHKSGKMQKYQADSEPRHSTDFRTIFGIMIG